MIAQEKCLNERSNTMKKFNVREVETLKTTAALYTHGCVLA